MGSGIIPLRRRSADAATGELWSIETACFLPRPWVSKPSVGPTAMVLETTTDISSSTLEHVEVMQWSKHVPWVPRPQGRSYPWVLQEVFHQRLGTFLSWSRIHG